MLPTTKFANRTGLGTSALLCVSHTLQRALDRGLEAWIFQIDFSASFNRVNHNVILFWLCFVGVGGPVLSVLTQFVSNRSQYVVVDGCRCKLVNVVSGVPQGSVSSLSYYLCTPLSFSPYWRTSFTVMLTDDLTLVVVVPSPSERVAAS